MEAAGPSPTHGRAGPERAEDTTWRLVDAPERACRLKRARLSESTPCADPLISPFHHRARKPCAVVTNGADDFHAVTQHLQQKHARFVAIRHSTGWNGRVLDHVSNSHDGVPTRADAVSMATRVPVASMQPQKNTFANRHRRDPRQTLQSCHRGKKRDSGESLSIAGATLERTGCQSLTDGRRPGLGWWSSFGSGISRPRRCAG